MSYKKGFSLIELLVVIGIIGILASIVMVSLSSAKYRANDAKRKSDLKNLALALSQYYNDNGSYPSTGGMWWGEASIDGTQYNSVYIRRLTPYTNTAALPEDPDPDTSQAYSGYQYKSDGQSYKLIDVNPANSTVNTLQTSDEFYDPVHNGPGNYAFMVCVGVTACSTW